MRLTDYRPLPQFALVATVLVIAMTASADPSSRTPNAGRQFKLLGFNLELGPRTQVSEGARPERAYLFEIRPLKLAGRGSKPVPKEPQVLPTLSSIGGSSPFVTSAIERVVVLEAERLRAYMPQVAIRADALFPRPIEGKVPVWQPPPLPVAKQSKPAECTAEAPAFASKASEPDLPNGVGVRDKSVVSKLTRNC